MSPTVRAPARPRIVLAETDAQRLDALAAQIELGSPIVAGLLLEELDRADVRPDAEVRPDIVRMGSTVEFIDEAHGERRTVRLVYPGEADIAEGRVSVLTPVGAGLIGLASGQVIVWPDREGRERRLRGLRVGPPPDAEAS